MVTQPVEPAAPLAATDTVAQDNSGTEALLIGLGLAAAVGALGFLAVRRRRVMAMTDDRVVRRDYLEPFSPVVSAPVERDPAYAMAEPAYGEGDGYAPVTQARRAPLVTNAFSGQAIDGDDVAAHREAIIAERPSAENPFLTRKNRLRRANFMMRNADMVDSVPDPAMGSVREPEVAQASSAGRPLQVTYNISGGPRRSGVLKPQFG
jgi:hypothetical protein